MNLFLLTVYGIIFSFSLQTYKSYKSSIKQINFSPFILLMLGSFCIIASTQYISNIPHAVDIITNDLPRYRHEYYVALECSDIINCIKKIQQEPIFVTILFIFSHLRIPFRIFLGILYFFIFCSSLKIFDLYNCKKNYRSIQIISFFTLFFLFIIVSFCLIRMGLAVSVSVYCLYELKKGKWLNSVILALFSMGIHFSASILIPIIFLFWILNKKNFDIKYVIRFFIISFISLFALSVLIVKYITYIFPRYACYVGSAVAVNTYLTNFFFIVLIMYKKKSFFIDKSDCLNFIVLLSTLYILPLQSMLGIFYRMLFYSYISTFICVYRIFCIYKKKNIIHYIVRAFIFFYLFYFAFKFYSQLWHSYGLENFSILKFD